MASRAREGAAIHVVDLLLGFVIYAVVDQAGIYLCQCVFNLAYRLRLPSPID